MTQKPNLLFIFADQLRASALGCMQDEAVQTPNLDRLAAQGMLCTNAIANSPVCTPSRASMITGKHALNARCFVNDVRLPVDEPSIAEELNSAGYKSAYIGKWHLDGISRHMFTKPERRHGFDTWKVLECTHDYSRSPYYAGNDNEKKQWEGYDPTAQTRDAAEYIRGRSKEKPFLLVLSWGPPHNPYETAPQEYKDLYSPESIILRPNVPETMATDRPLAIVLVIVDPF